MPKNWFERYEYVATWIQLLVIIFTLIPLSYLAGLFIIHGAIGSSIVVSGGASCLVKIVNQTAYDNLLKEICPQMKGTTHLPLPQKTLVPSVYEIGNLSNVAYVGFQVINEYGSCYVEATCYSE